MTNSETLSTKVLEKINKIFENFIKNIKKGQLNTPMFCK
jgi:hypothetical protein